MNEQIHFIDTVVVVPPDGVQPVDGFFSAIGSAFTKIGSKIGTAASKLGTIFKSPVMSKVLEGGIAVGGSLLLAKAQAKAAKSANAGLTTSAPTTYTPVTPPTSTGMSNTNKYLLYGGAALAAITLIVLVTNRRRK